MSILGLVPGGKVFGAVEGTRTRCVDSIEELRAKIYEGLLPAQKEFCDDTEHLILGMCAGFGAGKTAALCRKAILLAMENPGKVGAIFEPTFQLVRDVWMRSFDEVLESLGIEYDFRISPSPEYVLHLPNGSCTLLCRATETWNRIRGQNLAFILADEIDTSPLETSKKAVEMFLARLRGGDKPQLAMASTPEGYRIFYETFVEGGDKEDRRLIKARTHDNPHLPPGFIESLEANYPPNLLAAYLNGEFCLLDQTTVYPYFDRDRHWTDECVKSEDRVIVSVDFNVGACFLMVIVRRGENFHVVREAYPADTPKVVQWLKEEYPEQVSRGDLVVIPDAASRQRSTTNAAESDLSLLKKAGFVVKAQSANPQVADRVNAVNVLLMNDRLRIHNGCKYLIKSLEKQAFDRSGKPEKGIGGKEDISGPVDALGYGITYLAPLRRYQTGGSTVRLW
jgi:PBSX family phage terminase large subunit